jgi:hypothetical protein
MKIARSAAVTAPLFMLAYGVIRLIGRSDGVYGPGLDWQAAHLAMLAGLVLFVFLILAMRRLLAPGPLRETVIAITLVGAATSIVQFVADIVNGLLATDHADMSRFSESFGSVPGVEIAFYQVGPPLLYIGMIALAVLLARAGELPWWTAAVILVSSLLPVVTLNLLPLAAAGYLVALYPLRVPLGRAAVPSATAA